MNPYTGDLIALPWRTPASNPVRDLVETKLSADRLMPADFRPVPPNLRDAARTLLGGKQSAKVNLRNKSALAKWAATQRQRDTEKRRAKMAKESRRRNRK